MEIPIVNKNGVTYKQWCKAANIDSHKLGFFQRLQTISDWNLGVKPNDFTTLPPPSSHNV